MTIALGIRAQNGIVLAADREESTWTAKYEEVKFRGASYYPARGRFSKHLIIGAGWADHIDAFTQTIEDDKILADPRLDKSPTVVYGEALERFYAKKIIPFATYPENERPSMKLILGHVGAGRARLFVSDLSTLKRVDRFVVTGTGSDVARQIVVGLMGGPSSGIQLSVKEAVVIAARAVLEAKESVPGVGKDTDIHALFDSGKMETVVPPIQDALDAVLKRYGGEVEPMVMRSIIGTRPTQDAFDAIARLRVAIEKILGDSFTDSGERPVAPPAPPRSKRGRRGRPPSQE